MKTHLEHLDKHDSLRLASRGIYEPWETGIVKQVMKPGGVFVDVGAHIGYYTVMAADLVGPTGRVYAFEPAPENFATLMANIGPRQNVIAFPMAASSKAGQIDFYISRTNSGDNRVACPDYQHDKIKVMACRLDDTVPEPERIDFVKIDTQGHELAVLAGMMEILKKARGLRLLVEYEPVIMARNGIGPELLLETLRAAGFSYRSSATHDWRKCTAANRRHCNLYCRRK